MQPPGLFLVQTLPDLEMNTALRWPVVVVATTVLARKLLSRLLRLLWVVPPLCYSISCWATKANCVQLALVALWAYTVPYRSWMHCIDACIHIQRIFLPLCWVCASSLDPERLVSIPATFVWVDSQDLLQADFGMSAMPRTCMCKTEILM